MKITLVEKLEVKDGTFRIDYSPQNKTPLEISFNYTCPKCAGHGCSSTKQTKCFNGEISLDINPEDLKTFFGNDDSARAGLLSLLECLCKNLTI